MIRKCRIWWPTHLSTHPLQPSSTFLFGWFLESPSSNLLDVVVAFGCTHTSLLHSSRLQEIAHQINGRMPMGLQDECMLSMLGCCQENLQGDGKSITSVAKTDNGTDSINGIVYSKKGKKSLKKKKNLLEVNRRAFTEKKNWIQLVYDFPEYVGKIIYWIPKLQHLKWDGMTVPDLHLHVCHGI